MENKDVLKTKTVGDYKIFTNTPLGEGSLGIVYPGICITTSQPVAVK